MRSVCLPAALLLGLVLTWAGDAAAQTRFPLDSLRELTESNDVRVIAAVREFPDSARAVWARMLALAAKSPDSSDAPISTARRLAQVYAIAWRDSFFVRQTARFEAWSPAQRKTKAIVDSLRLAGGTVLGQSGAAAATRVWRESLRLAQSIGDSAGQGGALGNIAVAFYRDGALDSAEAYLIRSRVVAERIGDTRTRLNAMGTLATVAKDRRDFTRARTLYLEAFALRAGIGDDRGAASDENNLGLVAEALGDTARARRNYEAALDRNRRGGRLPIASDNMMNLGNLATLGGDYDAAGALYRGALSIRQAAGTRAREAPVWLSIGRLEMRRGDFSAARDALTAAASTFDVTGPRASAIAAYGDLAQAQGAMGDLQPALTSLRRADSIAARDSSPGALGAVALARADLAVEFNAYGDAERSYAAASGWFAKLGDRAAEADAQQGLGLILLRKGDAAQATHAFESVLRSRVASHDRAATAIAQLLLGFSLMEVKNLRAARAELDSAVHSFTAVGDAVGEASALGALADLEVSANNAATAQTLCDRALKRLGDRQAPAAAADLRSKRARLALMRGDLASAATDFRAVIDVTERVAGAIALSERRAGFREDKWAAYEQLALIERRRGRDESAFAISERLRGRAMLDLLAEGRVAATTPRDSALIATEQNLRHRIAVLERSLETARGRDQVRGLMFRSDATGASLQALDAAQRAYTDVLARLRDSRSAYAQLVQPPTVDAKTVSRRLAADEALLEYLVTDSTTLAFVVRRDQTIAFDLGVGRRELAAAIDFTRSAIGGAGSGSLRDAWRAPLQRLHRLLIDPVERSGALRGARTLLIAPHAELHYLPFAALIAPDPAARFLIERYDIAYVPSASLWTRLVDRNSAAHSSGVVAFAPHPDALPASRDEVAALQAVYGKSVTVLSGAAATEGAFRAAAKNASIVHVATYGVLNKHNPLFSFIELAPGGHDDGHLAVHDVFGIELHARLVVLSACQTALASGMTADVPAGDDWVGLVRAFLFAGADNVLATLWPIQDRAAATVMRDFYQELSAHSLSGALAEAQRRAIRDPRTADPANWAAYALVGAAR